jgi:hypothetical protein
VPTPIVLVATWQDGLFVLAGETLDPELPNQSVRALAPDGQGGALAIVDGRSLCRRAPDGVWSTIAATELDLACCVAVGSVIYIGTDDARVHASARTAHSSHCRASTWSPGVRHGMRARPSSTVNAWDRRSGSARSRQPRTARSSSPTSTSAVSLGRATAAQRGSRPSTWRATSTRFARTPTVRAS